MLASTVQQFCTCYESRYLHGIIFPHSCT